MLSAHQPYQGYPDIIKAALAELGHSAQVAGGVPAMCDGVTQGQPGMDMSLFSRDLIAQATARVPLPQHLRRHPAARHL
jgi:phosphogluconate dehydratase